MNLTTQDLATVQLVGRFSQLASTHVGEILFADRTGTPLDRALTRLVRHGYLRRVGRRSTDSAGSGGYVYELGKLGWAELRSPEGYRRKYGISNHALKVADIYVEFVRAHRAGHVELIHWEIEKPYGDARADLVVHLGRDGKRLDYCLEVDLGTERPHIIRRKLTTYWQTFTASGDLPYVAFIVPVQYSRTANRSKKRRFIRGLADYFDDHSVAGVKKVKVEPNFVGMRWVDLNCHFNLRGDSLQRLLPGRLYRLGLTRFAADRFKQCC